MVDDWFKRYINRQSTSSSSSSTNSSLNSNSSTTRTTSKPGGKQNAENVNRHVPKQSTTAHLNHLSASKPKASLQTTTRKIPSKSEVPAIQKPISSNTKDQIHNTVASKKEPVPKSISLSKNLAGSTKQVATTQQIFARKPQILPPADSKLQKTNVLSNTKPQIPPPADSKLQKTSVITNTKPQIPPQTDLKLPKTNTLTNSKPTNKIELEPKQDIAKNIEKEKTQIITKTEENKENINEPDKTTKSETLNRGCAESRAENNETTLTTSHNSNAQPRTSEIQSNQQQNRNQQQGNGSSFTPEDFVFGKILGKGQFGHVYIARHITTKFVVALKIIGKVQIAKYSAENNIQREIEIQSHLKHPNIIKLYSFFQDAKRYYLLLEYAPNGELYKLMQKVEKFDEKTSANYMIQLTSAIAYCHKFNIIHRDLKLENILIGKNNDLKIADFGWSVHSPSSRRRTMCGTLDYLAPEITENKPHDANVDIWCLGILCYEFLVGRAPFAGKDTTETYELIRRVRYTCPDHVSKLAKEFIAKLLVYIPANRLQLNKFPEQPWIKEHIENPKLI